MEIISLLVIGLASYVLGKVLARLLFGYVFEWIEKRNEHVAMAYLVLLLLLLIATLVYMVIRLF